MKILDNTELSIRRELHLLFLIMIDALLPCNFVFWSIYCHHSYESWEPMGNYGDLSVIMRKPKVF